MLNFGAGEIIVLLLIAFIVVGPEDLPKVAVAIAKAIKYVRLHMKEAMKALELEEEIKELKNIKKTTDIIRNPKSIVEPIKKEISQTSKEITKEITDIGKDITSLQTESKNEN